MVLVGPLRELRRNISSLVMAASPPMHREETVRIALLLAFTGGYIG